MVRTGKQSHLSAQRLRRKRGGNRMTEERRSFDENFGTRSLRGRQPSVARERTRDSKSTPRVNSRRWQTMRGVTKALSSLRPTGCSVANIQSSVHSPLWKGKGSQEGGGTPSITWEIALALFMCVYTDTGCTRPRHAIPRHSSLQRLSMARQRGHK